MSNTNDRRRNEQLRSDRTPGARLFATTAALCLLIIPATTQAQSKFANISTRMVCGTDDDAIVNEFMIEGSVSKKVLVRAIGPSLSAGGKLADPTIELRDSAGTLHLANNNWRDTQEAEIQATGLPPSNNLESAIVATLPPGLYATQIRGVNNTTGLALSEVYDVESSNSTVTALGTRGRVETGDAVMIAGLILTGSQNEQILARALGPSLSVAGVSGTLSNTILEVFDGNGNVVATNDNWRESQETAIQNTGLAPPSDLESAISITLAPGPYTGIVRGAGSTTGVGFIQFYMLPFTSPQLDPAPSFPPPGSSDVAIVYIHKTRFLEQTGPADPISRVDPFTFSAGINSTSPNSVLNASFTRPGGGSTAMTNTGQGDFFFLSQPFATQAALDAAFPNGTYTFALQTQSASNFAPSVSLNGSDPYPVVPKILNPNWTGGRLQIDATEASTLNWSSFSNGPSGAGTTRGLSVLITDQQSGALVFNDSPDPAATSIALPANTLQPGRIYRARLSFTGGRFTMAGSTALDGAFRSETTFDIETVAGVPVITSPLTVTFTQGETIVYQLTASNNPTSFNATGLPAGLSFDPALDAIIGAPGEAGTFQAQLSATNVSGTGTANLVINVEPPPATGPVFTSGTSATGRTGEPFSFQVVTSGGTADARLSATGLPSGLSLNPVTGLISGTPATDETANVTLTVTDGSITRSSTLQLTFSSDPTLPVIVSANQATLAPGQPFSYTILAPTSNAADDPVTYTLVGVLPQGLVFDPATGTISGTFGGGAQRRGSGEPGDEKRLSGGVITNVQIFATNSRGTTSVPLIFFRAPVGVVNISTRIAVGTGDNVLIGGFIITGNAPKKLIIRAVGPSLAGGDAAVSGIIQDPVMELVSGSSGEQLGVNDNWRSFQEQEIIDSGVAPLHELESAIIATLEPGDYTAVVRGSDGGTGIGLVELYDLGTASLDTSSTAKLANISTRGVVEAGDNVMIGGFIVSGASSKVIVRAIGPSLQQQNVAGALTDTTLDLIDGSGSLITTNDDWRSDQEQQIIETTVQPADPRESAVVATLVPGAYTAVVRGKGGATGVGLVEAYALQ